MVHALQEAHRVLKPNSLLIDLRPAAVHRRVELMRAGRFRYVGIMHEKFDDDRAADRAVAQVVREGLFKTEWRKQFECTRVMDTMDEFHDWLDEFVQLSKLPSHAWLIRAVERALSEKPAAQHAKSQIVVKGPLMMGVLRKRE